MHEKFPEEVVKELKLYIYRLVDPRNGETFYVGKGTGNRVFEHAKGASKISTEEEPDNDPKLCRIREIRSSGLKVGHVIHCHGIEDTDTAYRIEAAIIDAYAGLTNKVSGHDAGYFGVAHADELIARYRADPFQPKHKIILISVGVTHRDNDVYDAVRYAWSVDPKKLVGRLVLAHVRGLVRGVFEAEKWIPATPKNFPGFPLIPLDGRQRFGFSGKPADESIAKQYLNRRVPKIYRQPGAANPIRYIDPN